MTSRAGRLTSAHLLILPIVALVVSDCAPAIKSTATKPLTPADIAQLWVEPGARDLYHGPGGKDGSPDRSTTYKVTRFDTAGFSRGYDVRDQQDRKWKIKLGAEVQPEIIASRLLWGIGFHQPALYLAGPIKLQGGAEEDNGRIARLRLEEGYDVEDDWSWHQNPFVGTRQLKGLLVANLILNNWDLKQPQNRIYTVENGMSGPGRWFVVQDLGAALGKTARPAGTRNNIEHFESQKLIRVVRDGFVEFDYHARHRELFKDITAADVVWACRQFARLSDQQWGDAFRAASFEANLQKRFIAKLKSKIQEGLALEKRAAATP